MVHPLPGALRHHQSGRLLYRASANCHFSGRACIFVLPGAGRLVPVAEDQRTGPGGFTTVILLLLLIGSILMICLGIIGYYIAKIYEEIKDPAPVHHQDPVSILHA